MIGSHRLREVASLAGRLGAPAVLVTAFCLLLGSAWFGLLASRTSMGMPLAGFVDAPVAFSWNPFDHSLQKAVEKRYAEAFGLRPFLVRLGNELDYRLLRTSRMYHNAILIGSNGTLYERAYVEESYGYRPAPSDREVEEIVRAFARLRDALAARGIALAIVGVPNKVTIRPDDVPYWFPRFEREGARAYDRTAAAMRRMRLPFYDGREAVRSFGDDRNAMFPAGGTHWTHLAAFAALDEPFAAITRERTGVPGRIVLEDIKHQDRAVGSDADLLYLANLLFPDDSYGSDLVALRTEGAALDRPVVIVGSSFSFQMHWVLEAAKAAPAVHALHYLTHHYSCAECPPKPVENEWPKLVESASAVVVEMNETVFFLHPFSESYTRKFIDRLVVDMQPPEIGPAGLATQGVEDQGAAPP